MRNAVGHQSAKYISEAGDDPTPTTQDTELDEIRAIINQFGNWQSNKDFQPKKIAADIHQWAERKYGEREAEIEQDKLNKIETIVGYLQPLYDDLDVIKQNTSWHFLPSLIDEANEWVETLTPTTTPNDDERES